MSQGRFWGLADHTLFDNAQKAAPTERTLQVQHRVEQETEYDGIS